MSANSQGWKYRLSRESAARVRAAAARYTPMGRFLKESQKSGNRARGVTDAGTRRRSPTKWGVFVRKKLLYLPGIQVGFREESYRYPAARILTGSVSTMRGLRKPRTGVPHTCSSARRERSRSASLNEVWDCP